MSHRIPDCNLETLQAKIAKLGRKAVKLGLVPPVVTITGTQDVPVGYKKIRDGFRLEQVEFDGVNYKLEDGDKVTCHRRYHLVELTGEAPVIPGWELIAVVDHTTDSDIGNVIRTVPGKECPTEYRGAEAFCQHCNQTRRRNETFVLRSPEGTYKQIGRNCLADFCRSPEAAANLVAAASILDQALGCLTMAEEEDGFGMGGRGRTFYQIEEVVSLTAAVIRGCGWVSRSKANETPGTRATADNVLDCLSLRGQADEAALAKRDPELFKAYKSQDPKDGAKATSALEWIRAKRDASETLGDYLYNLLVVCSMEVIEKKHLGLACSLIAAYDRDNVQPANPTSNHVGVIGKRQVFSLKLTSVQHVESYYGTKHLYKFADAAGNLLIWWASKELDMDEGTFYDIKGTVKAHSEYKGTKQTELSRCVVS